MSRQQQQNNYATEEILRRKQQLEAQLAQTVNQLDQINGSRHHNSSTTKKITETLCLLLPL